MTAKVDPAADVEPVVAVIQHEVRPDAVERYETWLARIMPAAADFAGHRGVHVIRPGPTGRRRYTVTVRFASVGFAKAWFESATRRALMRCWPVTKPSTPWPAWNSGSNADPALRCAGSSSR